MVYLYITIFVFLILDLFILSFIVLILYVPKYIYLFGLLEIALGVTVYTLCFCKFVY